MVLAVWGGALRVRRRRHDDGRHGVEHKHEHDGDVDVDVDGDVDDPDDPDDRRDVQRDDGDPDDRRVDQQHLGQHWPDDDRREPVAIRTGP